MIIINIDFEYYNYFFINYKLENNFLKIKF